MNPTFRSVFEKAGIMKIALCCVFCIFLTCCESEETKDCPGFSLSVSEYYPYNKGDNLLFVNQHNDTISFLVNMIHVTEKHVIVTKTGRKYCTCACENPAFELNAMYLNCIIYASETGDFPDTRIEFSLKNSYWENSVLSKEMMERYGNYSFLEKRIENYPYDITNSAIFGETVILERPNQQISRVEIVKGKGIIEFYDQGYNFHWKSIKK